MPAIGSRPPRPTPRDATSGAGVAGPADGARFSKSPGKERPSMTERCAVVTGGGRNIGQAIALRLQEDGFRVIILEIVSPEAKSLQADAKLVDLSDRSAAERAFAEIAATLPVKALVNNVGIVA